MKLIINAEDQTILGATLFCASAGELISIVQMAMEAKFTYDFFRSRMLSHPTLAEGFNMI